MKLKLFMLFALSAMVMSFSISQGKANWEKLGSKVVNYGLEKDVIVVGAHEGGFTKLRIVVKGGAINMHKMTVNFANGTSQDVELKHNFSKASASREIDLAGEKRIIKTIEFVYDTKNLARSKAVVSVFGKH
jgi:hypothetical protein